MPYLVIINEYLLIVERYHCILYGVSNKRKNLRIKVEICFTPCHFKIFSLFVSGAIWISQLGKKALTLIGILKILME